MSGENVGVSLVVFFVGKVPFLICHVMMSFHEILVASCEFPVYGL